MSHGEQFSSILHTVEVVFLVHPEEVVTSVDLEIPPVPYTERRGVEGVVVPLEMISQRDWRCNSLLCH